MIEKIKNPDGQTCSKLYALTALGLEERNKWRNLVGKIDRGDVSHTEGMRHFEAGHYKKLANWRAMLRAMPTDCWTPAADIARACSQFYGITGARKALREMLAEGLVERARTALNLCAWVYRPTVDAADFCRGAEV